MPANSVTQETFEREVLASEQPVIVDFWAPWCGPCRAVAPVLDQIAAERPSEVKVVKVNVDEEPELAARFGIASIPTIVLFEEGSPVAGAVGARSKTQLEESLGLTRSVDVNGAPEGGALRGFISRLSGDRS